MKNLRTEKEIISQWQQGHIEPMVSICCITYNHEKYIADAIESFLIQETDFPFEILIHDDASTDRTANIVREYEDRYPNLIKPIYQTENQYSQGKRVGLFNTNRAEGKYIAFCEGDDYWTDSHKLKIQFEFLEANPEYSFCHSEHDYMDMIIGKKTHNRWKTLNICNDSGNNWAKLIISDQHIICTCTAFVRTATLKAILLEHAEDFDSRYLMGDNQMWFHLARRGKVKYFQKSMVVYRRVMNSATATDDNIKRYRFIKNVYWQRRSFAERYNYKEVLPKIDRIYLNSLLRLAVLSRDRNGMMEYAARLTKLGFWDDKMKGVQFAARHNWFFLLHSYYILKNILKKSLNASLLRAINIGHFK